jgi:hypothetical protein
MKDFPGYNRLIYYFSDKTKKTDLNISEYETCCGVLLYTENNTFFFNPFKGGYIIPDHICDRSEMVPHEWFSVEAMKWAIKNQPFDSKETWFIGTSMYAKDLFKTILVDIRDFKINNILEKI